MFYLYLEISERTGCRRVLPWMYCLKLTIWMILCCYFQPVWTFARILDVCRTLRAGGLSYSLAVLENVKWSVLLNYLYFQVWTLTTSGCSRHLLSACSNENWSIALERDIYAQELSVKMSKVLRTEINLKEKFRLPKKLLSLQTPYLSLALRIRAFCLSNLELT